MKKTLLGLLCLLFSLSASAAATIVVDRFCPTAGNGTGGYTSTCDGTAAGNPAADIDTAISALASAGDIIDIRGIHAAHGSCPGSTSGRYFGDVFRITSKNGVAGNPIIIENSGYTGPGTGETVYVDGTRCAHNAGGSCNSAWTHCVWSGTCSCGSVGDGSQAACEATWSVTDDGTAPTGFPNGNANGVIGAQKDNGEPTQRVLSLAAMTNATSSYNANRCTNAADSSQNFIACNADSDCPHGETCSTTSAEIDSFKSGSTLYVRWGASLPINPYIFYTQNGNGFLVVTSSYINIHGLWFRDHERAAIHLDDSATGAGAVHHFLITGNHVFYSMDAYASGSDYSFVCDACQDTTFTYNEIAYTGSEFHLQGLRNNVATRITVQHNWFHDIGDQNVLGLGESGTPHAMIWGEQGGAPGTGNYTGSDLSDNFIVNIKNAVGLSAGMGLILENDSDGLAIHDNIFINLDGPVAKYTATNGTTSFGPSTSNHDFYNNLCINYGLKPGGNSNYAIYYVTGANTSNDNNFFNNTFVGASPSGGAIEVTSAENSGTVLRNIFRNNIMYFNGNQKEVDFQKTDSSNGFDHNFVITTANPAVTWLNVGYACSALGGIPGGGNLVGCADPQFASATTNNYHILTGSPAKDAGTSTGMPAGKTRDISNTVAVQHGLPQYKGIPQIGSAWDIGACEFTRRRYFVISHFEWKRPEPWTIANAAWLRLHPEEEN